MKIDTVEYLNSNQIKPSLQRVKIFEYLSKSTSHPTVDEIYSKLIKEIPTLSKTTIYNTLNLFVERGIAKQILSKGAEKRYDGDVSDHGHFKCENCGRVYDFAINLDDSLIEGLNGFVVKEKTVYFKGICNDCSN